ncbi:MAG: fumarylacetoacetate hydrolase family protein [Sterolibacteriaceae bacterium]|nr:fumarylacetoacetate hydrolase family protein [Sterolibacteriaceae bacterium]
MTAVSSSANRRLARLAQRSGAVLPYPARTASLHHEVELVGDRAGRPRHPGEQKSTAAMSFGYAVGVDLTRRDLQGGRAKGQPWDMARSFDRSAPVSPSCRCRRRHHVERKIELQSQRPELRPNPATLPT